MGMALIHARLSQKSLSGTSSFRTRTNAECRIMTAHIHVVLVYTVQFTFSFFSAQFNDRILCRPCQLGFVITFLLYSAQGLQLKQLAMIAEGIAASSRTLTRMVCITALKRLRKRGMRIGGRHRFVVIDESKFAHKRKYHRGRCGNTWHLSDRNSRRPILRLVRNRTRQTLIGQIKMACKTQNIHPH